MMLSGKIRILLKKTGKGESVFPSEGSVQKLEVQLFLKFKLSLSFDTSLELAVLISIFASF